MEFFVEFLWTTVLSLLLFFLLGKLLIFSSTTDCETASTFSSCKGVIDPDACKHKFVSESIDCDSDNEGEKELGSVVAKPEEIHEFSESMQEISTLKEFSDEDNECIMMDDDMKVDENENFDETMGSTEKPLEDFSPNEEDFTIQEIPNEGVGSPKIEKDLKFDENDNSRKVEIDDSLERSVQESLSKCSCCEVGNEVHLVDEITESARFGEIGTNRLNDEVSIAKTEEIEVFECEADKETDGGNKNEEKNCLKEGFLEDEDDWEGIERTELEKLFSAAVVFVESECNADQILNLSSEVKLQLYGLQKIATEGPCNEARPMALKVYARAKWNAWQTLGNMNPELAIEQYITLLSKVIPGWMLEDSNSDSKHVKASSDLTTMLKVQPTIVDKRDVDEMQPHVEGLIENQSGLQIP